MSKTITFSEMKLEGGWLMVKPEREDMGKAMHLIRNRKHCRYDMEIKEHRKKRSLDANAYAWVLIGKLAEAMRITPLEVYRQAIRDVGGNYEIIPIKEEAAEHFKRIWESKGLGWPCEDMGASKIPGYRNMRAFYGSSTFDSRQMGVMIESLQQDCAALDIEYLTPEKVALLMEEWDAK
jgi:hypothetical protein